MKTAQEQNKKGATVAAGAWNLYKSTERKLGGVGGGGEREGQLQNFNSKSAGLSTESVS